MKPTALIPLFFACLAISLSDSRAESWTEPLSVLNQVGPEGEGNIEAAEAWADLTKQGPSVLIPTLSAMGDASPLARNWMRTAVETVFDSGLAAKGELPEEEIQSFLLDRSNDPNARTLAFDLLERLDSDRASSLIPGMADDPSTPLRRKAVAALIQSGEAQIDTDGDAATKTLSEALDAARDVDQIDTIAKLLRGKLEQEIDLPRHFGFLMYWHLIGPFDNTDRAGFEAAYPPESGIDLEATYEGKEGKTVAWVPYSTSDDYGKVDFNQPFSPLKQVVGYAYTEFESDEERVAELRLGCKNAWKIWFNGELLFGRDEYHRGQRIDQYVLPVTLQKGTNTILVKACQNEQEQDWTVQWEFQLRVCDSTGTAILSTDRKATPKPETKTRRPAPAN